MTVAQAAVDRQFQFLRLYGRHISADITQMTGRKPGSESLVVRAGSAGKRFLASWDLIRGGGLRTQHVTAASPPGWRSLDRRRTYVGPGPRATRGQDGARSHHGGRAQRGEPFEADGE